MNCAPISVPASRPSAIKVSNKQLYAMASLPNLFRANIGNGCKSAQSGTVLAIPHGNLGKDVERIGSDPLVPPLGNCGDSVPPSDPAAAPGAGKTSPAPPTGEAQPNTQVPPASLSQPRLSAKPSNVKPTSMSAPIAGPTGDGGSLSPDLQQGTCHAPGKSVCSPDGKSWGTCDDKNKVIYQPVAIGTNCDPTLGVEVAAHREKKWIA